MGRDHSKNLGDLSEKKLLLCCSGRLATNGGGSRPSPVPNTRLRKQRVPKKTHCTVASGEKNKIISPSFQTWLPSHIPPVEKVHPSGRGPEGIRKWTALDSQSISRHGVTAQSGKVTPILYRPSEIESYAGPGETPAKPYQEPRRRSKGSHIIPACTHAAGSVMAAHVTERRCLRRSGTFSSSCALHASLSEFGSHAPLSLLSRFQVGGAPTRAGTGCAHAPDPFFRGLTLSL